MYVYVCACTHALPHWPCSYRIVLSLHEYYARVRMCTASILARVGTTSTPRSHGVHWRLQLMPDRL